MDKRLAGVAALETRDARRAGLSVGHQRAQAFQHLAAFLEIRIRKYRDKFFPASTRQHIRRPQNRAPGP